MSGLDTVARGSVGLRDDELRKHSDEACAIILDKLRGHEGGLRFGLILSACGGAVSAGMLRNGLQRLIAERRIACVTKGTKGTAKGETTYRLPIAGEDLLPGPPVRSIPIPEFNPAITLEAVAGVLSNGASQTMPGLVSLVRPFDVHATAVSVGAAIDVLIDEGKVTREAFGSIVRFRWASR